MSIKHLFFTAFLALGLVGCSSTPTSENDVEQTKQASAKDAGEKGADVQGAEAVATQKAEELAAQAEKVKQLEAEVQGKMVHFDFDRSEVKPEYYSVIQAVADYMAADTALSVTVEGHCDERGTREYNLALGERRAKAVKNALVAQGVSPDRISTISYGEERPLDPRHNEEAWSKNRRGEFKFSQ